MTDLLQTPVKQQREPSPGAIPPPPVFFGGDSPALFSASFRGGGAATPSAATPPALFSQGGGGATTPPVVKDRFIAHRGTHDSATISHFLLTTEDPRTPLLLSRQGTPLRGAAAGGMGTPRAPASAANSGSRGFTVSPSPARSLLFGATGGSVASGGGSEPSHSLSRNLSSLFNSPSRFESEVGTDAALDGEGGDAERMDSLSRLCRRSRSGAVSNGDPAEAGAATASAAAAGPAAGLATASPVSSNVIVNVEPYNARLARSLFSDKVQTSVLCHTSGNNNNNSNNNNGNESPSSPVLPLNASPNFPAMNCSPLGGSTASSSALRRACGNDNEEDDVDGEDGVCVLSATHRSGLSALSCTGRRLFADDNENTNEEDDACLGLHNTFSSSQTLRARNNSAINIASNYHSTFHTSSTFDNNNNSNNNNDNNNNNEAEHFLQRPAVVFEQNKAKNFITKSFRHIPSTPERILDAANLVDQFYYNVLDCSCHDVVAVALQQSLYLWDWATENITTLPNEAVNISGVKFAPDGYRLASSNEEGDVVVWNTTTSKDEAVFTIHQQRVCSLAWNATGNLLASGGKDAMILLNDVRSKTPALTLSGAHTKEVCGLQWSLHDLYLASGGDDNRLLVWDSRRLDVPLHQFTKHSSAIKALSWNPVQPHLLVSGGGVEDQMLRFWSVDTGECVREVNTHSQVCGLVWHHSGTELVSCHGYPKNQITLWRYPSLSKVVDLCGHRSRVLHLCLSSNGQTVISAASDETVRFWTCFPPPQRERSHSSSLPRHE